MELNRTRVNDHGQIFEHIMIPQFNHNTKISFEKKGFLIELLSKTQTSSYLNKENTYTIGGFTKFDANIGYTESKYSILFSVNNITSQKYYTNGNADDTKRYLFVNPLINAFVTLKYIF